MSDTNTGVARQLFETSPPTDFKVVEFVNGVCEFNPPVRALSWAVDGDIQMDLIGSVQAKILPEGSLAPLTQNGMVVVKIFEGGTTATGIIGWY